MKSVCFFFPFVRYFNHAIVTALSDLNTFADSHKAHILTKQKEGGKGTKVKWRCSSVPLRLTVNHQLYEYTQKRCQ